MAKFIIQGDKRLEGSIVVNSSKNAALGILCASVMIKGKVVLRDMPRIQEIFRMLEVLQSIGVSCEWADQHTLRLDSSQELRLEDIDKKACTSMRAALMLLGALSSRVSQYKLYKSGGCKLGERTVRPHLYALEQFGVSVRSRSTYYEVQNQKLKGCNIVMYESGDTPTENAIMAAVLSSGVTTIKYASSNYMVQDLCHFLVKAGAKIKGIGTTTLTIEGVPTLRTSVDYAIMPDPIEAMAWISLAISTKSKFVIENCPLDFLELELEKLKVMGQSIILKNKRLSKNNKFAIVDIVCPPSTLNALPDKIYGRPFPGLNIDNLPFFVVIATQAKGRTLIHDWVYENRAVYYLDLQKLGAQLTLLDPHRVFVEGPTQLKGRDLVAPDAIRPAMVLLIGMLAAKGTSTIRNIYPVERGYENLAERLTALGAHIERVE